jgi:hypothetical protein
MPLLADDDDTWSMEDCIVKYDNKMESFKACKSKSIEEGIFGLGNKYKNKDILVLNNNGNYKPIAIADKNSDNLIAFLDAHAEKYGNDKDDYTTAASTDKFVKKHSKELKSVPDVTKTLPYWVQEYLDDNENARNLEFKSKRAKEDAEKEQRFKDYNKKAEQQRLSKIKGSGASNTPYRGIHYSGGDYYEESLKEGINNLSIETDDTKMDMVADENGKVTVTTEPITNVEETEEEAIEVAEV